MRDLARRDPSALLAGDQPVTLDEIQREPALLSAVKRAIDKKRTPGRFLLTRSADPAMVSGVSESLAGRAGYLTLWPMTVPGLRQGAVKFQNGDEAAPNEKAALKAALSLSAGRVRSARRAGSAAAGGA